MRILIKTPRLVVREYQPGEVELLLGLHSNEEVNRYISQQTDEQRRRRFEATLKTYENQTGLNRWGVFNPLDGDFIGTCKLMPSDDEPDKIELGYVLAHKYWGKGLATELAKALVDYGFNEKGLTSIYACVHPENMPSENVLLKTGFVRSGNVFWHGKDFNFYRIGK